MTVKFWKGFSKRINSTAVPAIAATAELTCRLKDDTSIHDPVLQLATNEFGYEYAQIGDFGKYYFVRDVVSIGNGLVEYHLTEDPLATYKTEIGNTSAHIAYATAGYDGTIIDPRIVVKNRRQIDKSGGATSTYQVFPSSGGWYILSVFNDKYVSGAGSSGFACSYALDDTGMSYIRRQLGNASLINGIEAFLNGDPLKAIFSCIWVPYDLSAVGVDTAYIEICGQTINENVSGHCRWLYEFSQETHTISVPCHLRYTDFRSAEPYTTGNIYLPGAGLINLNMGDWTGSSNINVEYTIEHITGNVRYFLKTDSGEIIQTIDCCVASQCPFGQTMLNGAAVTSGVMGIGTSAAMLAAGLAAGEAGAPMVAGAALSLITGASNTVLAANKRDTSIIGNIGGRVVQTQPYIQHTEFSVNTEDPNSLTYISERGRPYSGTAQISSLSGFIQCEGASINCAASATEKEEINNYLNSGFYYI